MKIQKDILVKGQHAVLTYDDIMFGKDANELKYILGQDANIILKDSGIKITLWINGEEYYNPDKEDYIDDFYFEVVDFYKDRELSYSDTIYEVVNNEEELLELLTSNSYYLDNLDEFRLCPKGHVIGYCDDETSNNCEYSALNPVGLCGAECQDCLGEMFAVAKDKAYICECSKILFEDRHVGIRELS